MSYGFVSQITVNAFELCYGTFLTISLRRSREVQGDQNRMGFGQLVPLLLLLLPCLAILEIYSGDISYINVFVALLTLGLPR